MTGPKQAAPRLALWGFACSLAGIVLPFVVFVTFPGFTPLTMSWGLLSIPGLVLSVWARRVARKLGAHGGWAVAGIVVGIVGMVAVVLWFAFWAFLWGMGTME